MYIQSTFNSILERMEIIRIRRAFQGMYEGGTTIDTLTDEKLMPRYNIT